MPQPSLTHLVLIPSYNTGPKVLTTVRDARRFWNPVWVVVDGSTDGTADALNDLAQQDQGVRVFVLPRNRGKGAAVLHGMKAAQAEGYTHALTMDADGQHAPHHIPDFMEASRRDPRAQILGQPIFDASAPAIRVQGRKLSNFLTNFETLWEGIGDSLYGFRVYPIDPLVHIMERRLWMRRFDFDAEAAVRLCWRRVHPVQLPTPVQYFRPEEGGVSHFHYGRDNLLLFCMHTRLVFEGLVRAPLILWRRLRRSRSAG